MSRERVTCPACDGSRREYRLTAFPGHHRYRDVGWCHRCDGYGTVATPSLSEREQAIVEQRTQTHLNKTSPQPLHRPGDTTHKEHTQ